MFIIGLTGSVGMGKSTTALMFSDLGVPVQDADAEVHRLMGYDGAAVPLVERSFPGVVSEGKVDRAALGQRVFGDDAALKELESILHPMVANLRTKFLERAARRGKPLVVLDIPLLFETNGDCNCDLTVLVSAPHFVQRNRFLRRTGTTSERLSLIRSKQMPDRAKRRLADVVIHTGAGRRVVRQSVRSIVKQYKGVQGSIWPPGPRPGIPGNTRPVVLSSLRKL